MEKLRVDKWLWAARFYKTRSLASDELIKGRIQVNGLDAKPSREIKPNDTLLIRQGPVSRTVVVLALSQQRGPASSAQQLYDETPESIQLRDKQIEQRRLAREPAQAIEDGRPTKRDRRNLEKAKTHNWHESSNE